MSFYRIQSYSPEALLEGTQTSLSYSTDTEREGKSVCRSIEELAAYVAQTGMSIDWADALLVEVEGTYSRDDDEDAHLGAYLIHPTKIISATPLDQTPFYDEVDAFCAAHPELGL